MLFLGIDAGTQGVRAAAVDPAGEVAAQCAYSYPVLNRAAPGQGPNRYEQSPEDWWSALCQVASRCTAALREAGRDPGEIAAVCVDGTSGTLLALDDSHRPLGNAILYNDLRSAGKAGDIGERAPGLACRLGYRITPSFSLPVALWFLEEAPEIYRRCRVFAHQTDYLLGRLCGEYGVSDYTNAQKCGYDAAAGEWPPELFRKLGLDPAKLPRVLAPGEPVGRVLPGVARELGLPENAVVTAGSTDAYAAVLAAGAVCPGDSVSVLGTTLVCKVVADRRITDPAGAGYPYRMPEGRWLVGGASSLGGRCVGELAGGDYARLDREALERIPTGVRCYPIYGRGERFPFSDPGAEPFFHGSFFGGRLYPALLEGVGFGERLCYERLTELGCAPGPVVRATGGGSKSPVWLKIRASILNRRLAVPEVTNAAMGAAMLAASGALGSLSAAVEAMGRTRLTVDPDPTLTGPYEELYQRFRRECREQYGY